MHTLRELLREIQREIDTTNRRRRQIRALEIELEIRLERLKELRRIRRVEWGHVKDRP